jgi:hypothetical protein
MNEFSSLRGTSALQAFLEALSEEMPQAGILEKLLEPLRREGTVESALASLKQRRPRQRHADAWQSVRKCLEDEAVKAQERRRHEWPLDPLRRTLRMRMEIRHPACLLHPPALQAILAKAFLETGIPLAMSLEKLPRPMLQLGHPLPSGVEGFSEWADAALPTPSPITLVQLPAHLQTHLDAGLKILEISEIPNISSPVQDLCCQAHWRWVCPDSLYEFAQKRFEEFEGAKSFTIEKMGKVEGRKQLKRLEVRPLVCTLLWEETTLCFSTRIAPGEALNPVKLLAGILELETSSIQGLSRDRVDLREDPRLCEAGRYETKLHNIYEDAVLLEGGPGLLAIEDDDDEPILLHKGRPRQE